MFPSSESQSDAQPPTWMTRVPLLVWPLPTRVPLLVWPLPFDLSAKVDPTSSYATDGKALRVIGVHELPYQE